MQTKPDTRINMKNVSKIQNTFKIFFLFLFLFTFTSKAQDLPKVFVLATGGTIAGTGTSEMQTTGYKSGVLTADKLIESVPSLSKVARISAEQVSNIGSDNINNEILLKLAKRVNTLLEDPSVSGIVITHGTDTLEETAYFLNLVVKSKKPVVLTASMRPSTAISADGPSNLLQAVIVAASHDAYGKGVMIVMNDRISSARYVTKTNGNTLDTFKDYEHGYLGHIVDQVPYFEMNTNKLNTTNTPFDIKNINKLPDVVITYGYQNDVPYMYDTAVEHGVKGIVIAGTGAGSESLSILPSIKNAIKKGVVVVRSSRTGSGYIADDSAYVGILGNDLNPQKARILLMLALTITNDQNRIQDMFNKY